MSTDTLVPTRRIALGLEYDGAAFHGWQSQPGGVGVQDALESALSTIGDERIQVSCAGRTDTGVHATVQVIHFDTAARRPDTAWVRGVNALLPDGVAVRWARVVPEDFHARFSAWGRHYRYLLINRPVRPALARGRAGWYHVPLDAAVMDQACAYLVGEHDFTAFRASECQAKSPVKILRQARVQRRGDWLVFDFWASAFLHHMVRNLVGSLVYVGNGKHPPAWIGELLAARDRSLAAPTFSAAGLYLVGVDYEDRWGLPPTVAGELPDLFPGVCL